MRITKWLAVITALNLFAAFSVQADSGSNTEDSGTVETGNPDKGVNPDKPEKPEHPEHPVHPEKPARPEKPDEHGKSGEMKAIVSDFRTKLTELNAQRVDLAKQMKDATEEQRAKLREDMAANRDAITHLKEQFRDEVRELHDTLKTHGNKVDAEAKAEAIAAAKGRSRE
jgi:Spy/CpxP family protein refolding chaperone